MTAFTVLTRFAVHYLKWCNSQSPDEDVHARLPQMGPNIHHIHYPALAAPTGASDKCAVKELSVGSVEIMWKTDKSISVTRIETVFIPG